MRVAAFMMVAAMLFVLDETDYFQYFLRHTTQHNAKYEIATAPLLKKREQQEKLQHIYVPSSFTAAPPRK